MLGYGIASPLPSIYVHAHTHVPTFTHIHTCRCMHGAGADTVPQARATKSTQEKKKETNPLRRPQEHSGDSCHLVTNRIAEPLKEELPGIF